MLIDRLRLEDQAVTESRQRLDKLRIVDGIVERMADLPDGVARALGATCSLPQTFSSSTSRVTSEPPAFANCRRTSAALGVRRSEMPRPVTCPFNGSMRRSPR